MNTFWRAILDPQLQKHQSQNPKSQKGINDKSKDQIASLSDVRSLETRRTSRAQEDWKKQQDSLWWDEHHSTIGNYKKVFPVAMCLVFPTVIFVLEVVPYYIFQIQNHEAYSLYFFVLEVVHLVCYLVIFGNIWKWIRRIQSVADSFGIGIELQQIAKCLGIFILLGQIAEVLMYQFRSDVSYLVLVSTISSSLSILPSIYIGSLFVLRRLFSDYGQSVTLRGRNFEEYDRLERIVFCRCTRSEEDTEEDIDAYIDASLQKVRDADEFTLNEVLSTKIGFEKFTQFLIAEWSVENILFLVEVKQYKARCRELLSQCLCILFASYFRVAVVLIEEILSLQ